MKSNRNIYLLLLVLALLIGLKLGQLLLTKKSNQSDHLAYQNYWQGITLKDISKLTLKDSTKSLDIEKAADNLWLINQIAADSTKINNLITQLVSPTQVELVAENQDQHASLGIASTSASLILTHPKGQQTLILGNSTAYGTYIKFTTNSQIYLLNNIVNTFNSLSPSDWIEKVIVKINQDTINQITLVSDNGKTSLILKQTDKKWYDSKTQEIDSTTLLPLLTSLSSLTVDGLINDPETTTIPLIPDQTTIIDTNDQKQVKLLFYSTKDAAVVKIDNKPGIYQINSSTLTNFKLKSSDLKFVTK